MLCVWVIDLDAFPQADYYTNTVCMNLYTPRWGSPALTEPWPGVQFSVQLQGIALPPGNSVMQGGVAALIVNFNSYLMPDTWFSVVAPDVFGLTSAGQGLGWSIVDGTILGVGNGGQAIFATPTTEETLLYAQYYPPGPQFPVLTGSGLAIDASSTTAESNNLAYTGSRPVFSCSDYQGGSCALYTTSGN